MPDAPLPIDENPFQWMQPNERSRLVIEDLREEFRAVYNYILREVPHSRERSVAITYLESAAMWAIKAAVSRIQ